MESLAYLENYRSRRQSWKTLVVAPESSGIVDNHTEEIYQTALYIAIKQFGVEHPEVAEAATYLGDLYLFLERFSEAKVLYKRALSIYENHYGQEHMLYSMALRNLAEALAGLGKLEEANELRLQARSIFG